MSKLTAGRSCAPAAGWLPIRVRGAPAPDGQDTGRLHSVAAGRPRAGHRHAPSNASACPHAGACARSPRPRRCPPGPRPSPSPPAPSTPSRSTATAAPRSLALDDVTVGIPAGRFTAVMGPSGSGKSTLMHCLAGLDIAHRRAASFIGDVELGALSDRELTRVRRERIGFVFQAFNLLPTLDAARTSPCRCPSPARKPDKRVGRTVVDTVGLGDRLKHRPSELSGGQQQRVAVARALASKPRADLRRRADRQPRQPHRRRDPRLHALAPSTSSARPS